MKPSKNSGKESKKFRAFRTPFAKGKKPNKDTSPEQHTPESSYVKIKKNQIRHLDSSGNMLFTKRGSKRSIDIKKEDTSIITDNLKNLSQVLTSKKSVARRVHNIKHNYHFAVQSKDKGNNEESGNEYYEFLLNEKETEIQRLKAQLNDSQNLPSESFALENHEIFRQTDFDNTVFAFEEEKVKYAAKLEAAENSIVELNEKLVTAEISNQRLSDQVELFLLERNEHESLTIGLMEALNRLFLQKGEEEIVERPFEKNGDRLKYFIGQILERQEQVKPYIDASCQTEVLVDKSMERKEKLIKLNQKNKKKKKQLLPRLLDDHAKFEIVEKGKVKDLCMEVDEMKRQLFHVTEFLKAQGKFRMGNNLPLEPQPEQEKKEEVSNDSYEIYRRDDRDYDYDSEEDEEEEEKEQYLSNRIKNNIAGHYD